MQDGACYRKDGNTVFIQIYNCTAYSDRDRTIGTLPDGFRPTEPIEGSSGIGAISLANAGQATCFVRVMLSGDVILAKGGASGAVSGQISFPVIP